MDFDPCKVFSDAELQRYGVTEPGELVDQGLGEQGCDYSADGFLVTVYKGEEQDAEYWQGRRDNFDVFESNQVGAHQGISMVTSAGEGVCSQMIESGGGSVSVSVTLDSDKIEGNDPCAKAMEIAELIEPKLPA
ncbi:hypothetical protein GCM10027563_35940 [Parasphingorhabdus pacifica]